jgi:hypothetical protein
MMKVEVTRSQLAAMTPVSRMSVIIGGLHSVVDDPAHGPVEVPAGAVTRAQWDGMSQDDRRAIVRAGTQIVDATP